MKTLNLTLLLIFIGISISFFYCSKEENQPPIACINGPWTFSKELNAYNGFLWVDPLCSSDPDGDNLSVRWDWTNDGIWDTPWGSEFTQYEYHYPGNGPATYTLKLEVSDGKASDYATAKVLVNPHK